ncbi:MAG: zinc-ribbon domain-containing protein [Burkholderiales bacterium]
MITSSGGETKSANEGETTMTIGVGGIAIRVGGTRAFFGSGILLLILAIMFAMFAPAFAAAPPARAVPKGNPHLASLQIEIWPEFDRPATALVILKGEIAAGVRLPAAVNLRIAARSGGPTAVAYSDESGGNLFNLKYDREDADDFITLKFNAPDRFFHIEYYDPLSARTPGRSYTYLWNGDLATERLRVALQEPAAASDISVQPPLADTAVDPDGLRYRSAELGAFQAGEQLGVQVGYTKADPRTTIAILKPEAPLASPAATAGRSKKELALWLVAIVAVLVAGGIGATAWWYRRKPVAEAQSSGAAFCTKCGSPLALGDRFCSKCGVALT